MSSYPTVRPEEIYPQFHREYIEPWPEGEGGNLVEFRLVYKGLLPSGNESHFKDKHRIRRLLHKQLKTLWETHPSLRGFTEVHPDGTRLLDRISSNYATWDYKCVPLVSSRVHAIACSLDILFLRRDQPGNLISNLGDVDNRVKVLFDALQVPDKSATLTDTPTEDEDPLFCLLENDRLITEVKITTDRLLTPLVGEESISEVELVIGVKVLLPDLDTFVWIG